MAVRNFLEIRSNGYAHLRGTGIEVGGFEHPAVLPQATRIIRCDRISIDEARKLFPEVDASKLPVVDVCIDLDDEGLSAFQNDSLDFVVCCHVLEHLKNPTKALADFFRVLKPGGAVALAIPDKRFTFDKNRPLTGWEPLKKIYMDKIDRPVPSDYFDVIKYNHSNMLHLSAAELEPHLIGLMKRREHLNIWDSAGFSDFVDQALGFLHQPYSLVFESLGEESAFEYFCVIEKRRIS